MSKRITFLSSAGVTVAYVRCVYERFLIVQYISVHLTVDNMVKKRIAVWIGKLNLDS